MKAKYLNILLVISLGLGLVLTSCSTKNMGISANYEYETECLGAEMDGTQELKAFGKGNKKKDVIRDAQKKALEDVCFNGIRKGSSECELAPVVTDANSKETHEKYYAKLFTKQRKYGDYVKVIDKSSLPKKFKVSEHGKSKLVFPIIVEVDRTDLQKKLTRKDAVETKYKKRKELK